MAALQLPKKKKKADGSALNLHNCIEGFQQAGECRASHWRFLVGSVFDWQRSVTIKHRGFLLQPIARSGRLTKLSLLEHKTMANPLFAQLAITTLLFVQVEHFQRQHVIEKPSFIRIIDFEGLIFLQYIFVAYLHTG